MHVGEEKESKTFGQKPNFNSLFWGRERRPYLIKLQVIALLIMELLVIELLVIQLLVIELLAIKLGTVH